MKKFSILGIFLGLVTFMTIAVAYSANLFFDDTYYSDNQNENQGYYVTLDYNDGFNNEYQYYLTSSSGVVNTSRSDVVELLVNTSDHTLDGWYLTKNGFYDDGISSKYNGESLSSGTRLYAKYINNKFSSYETINPSSSSYKNRVYLSNYQTLSQVYTLNAGESINVYYNTSNTGFNQDTGGSNNTTFKVPSKAPVVLTLDTNLYINGGTLKLNSIIGGDNGSMHNVLSSDTAFTCLDLNGYTITLANGGNIYGYGLIYNSQNTGGIIAEEGTITTPFVPYGYGGGGKTTYYYKNTYCPFPNYLTPYLSCETLFTADSSLIGYASLYANKQKNNTTIDLIGGSDSSLLQIIKGYIIRRETSLNTIYNNINAYPITSFYEFLTSENYRENIIMTNHPSKHLANLTYYDDVYVDKAEVTLNDLSMPLKMSVAFNDINMTVSMKYVDFPLPSFMSLYGYSVDFTFNIGIVAQPGSEIYFDESSSVKFSYVMAQDNKYYIYARLSVRDRYALDARYKSGSTTYGYPNNSLIGGTYGTKRLIGSAEPAKTTILGSVYFDREPGNFDLASNYYFYSIGGDITLSDQALNCITSNSDIVKLSNYYTDLVYYANSDTTLANYFANALYYNNEPLVSNGKAYFQDGTSSIVLVSSNFDVENEVYQVGSDYYYYKSNSSTFSFSGGNATSLTSLNGNPPSSSDYSQRFGNIAGSFQKADSYTSFDASGDNIAYITVGTSYYVNICGEFVELASAPTTSNFSSIDLKSSTNRFSNCGGSNNGTKYYTISSKAYFDQIYLKCWRLVNA